MVYSELIILLVWAIFVKSRTSQRLTNYDTLEISFLVSSSGRKIF